MILVIARQLGSYHRLLGKNEIHVYFANFPWLKASEHAGECAEMGILCKNQLKVMQRVPCDQSQYG